MPLRSNELAGLSLEELLVRFDNLDLAPHAEFEAQIQTELLVRNIQALQASAAAALQASRRLETLIQWLNGFSILLVMLTIAIVVFTAVVATGS